MDWLGLARIGLDWIRTRLVAREARNAMMASRTNDDDDAED